ncbi:MAG: thermonuclease family protein [Alphaproteobacteria bacterium]|nr:thermonuclease family protein [Alphaproteobacteria bacterium]
MITHIKLRVAVPLVLIGAIFSSVAGAAERLEGPIPAQVVRVVDGDTLMVRAHIWLGQEVETLVRLEGTDTPELKARCEQEREKALAARDFLVARVDGKLVQLHDILTDKYGGRVRAQVLDASGADLSVELIKQGLARRYDGGQRQSWCTGAE